MDTMLKEILHFNNTGVQLLESNNAKDAIMAFQNGVKTIKRYSLISLSPSTFNDDGMSISTSQSIASTTIKSLPTILYHFGGRVEGLQNGLIYTFNRPLMLHVRETRESTSTTTSSSSIGCVNQCIVSSQLHDAVDNDFHDIVESIMTVTTVAMIFNMALATHKLALQYGKSDFVQRAITTYTVAATLLHESDDDVVVMPLQQYTHDIINGIIMNNLACLHCELCDYQKCYIELQCMNDLLVYEKFAGIMATTTTPTTISNHYNLIESDELFELKLNCAFGTVSVAAKAA